jgi:SAM-dependent methyltransferase
MADSFSYRFYYFTLRTALSHAVFPHKRRERLEASVKDQYSGNYSEETNEGFMQRRRSMFLKGKHIPDFPVVEHKRILLKKFSEIFLRFDTESLLELGSGRGFNILSLAVLCPEIKKLRGVELSPHGVETAKKNFKNPPLALLSQLTSVSEEEITRRLTGRDIDFIEGSITKLPFESKSFDAVFSNSVIEQIPKEYPSVFSEASRVARKVGVWSEPFREAQQHHPMKLLYLKNTDHFRASYKDIETCGWKVRDFEVSELQKFEFNTAFVTATPSGEKR